jgi:DNA polymerase III subunit delta
VKLTGAAVTGALDKLPAGARVVLLFGPDEALVRERAMRLGKQIVADLSDPFNVVELTAGAIISDPARLADEASSMSLMGGRRLIRVFGGDDGLVGAVEAALEAPGADSLIVILGGDLAPKSKLRALAEGKNPALLALACYAEDAASLTRTLLSEAKAQGVGLDRDAAQAIVAATGAERDVARQELAKLVLYKTGQPGPISLADVEAVGADLGAAGTDALISAVFGGQSQQAAAQLARLRDAGENGIMLIRALARRLWQLEQAYASGGDLDAAADKLLGKMAWKDKPAFLAQAHRFPPARLAQARARLLAADRDARLSGANGDMVVAQAILGLTAVAARA